MEDKFTVAQGRANVATGEKVFRERMKSFFGRHNMTAETSDHIASIAGRLVQTTAHELAGANLVQLASDIRAVAASALRQHEQMTITGSPTGEHKLFLTVSLPSRHIELSDLIQTITNQIVTAASPPAKLIEPATPGLGFYDRLVAEKDELDERTRKLKNFLDSMEFLELSSEDQRLLRKQFLHMAGYFDILVDRIQSIQKQAGQVSASEALEEDYQRAQQTRGVATSPFREVAEASAGEEIEEGVRVTGGGQSEDPLPFNG